MLDAKSIFTSKTFWFNTLSILAVVLATMAGWEELKSDAPYLMALVNVINIVLRLITKQPVTILPPDKPEEPKPPETEDML